MSDSIMQLKKLAQHLEGALEETITKDISPEILQMSDDEKRDLIIDAAKEALETADPAEMFSLANSFFNVSETALDKLAEDASKDAIEKLPDLKIMDLVMVWEVATEKEAKQGLDEKSWEKYRESLLTETEKALENKKEYTDFLENGSWAVIFGSLSKKGYFNLVLQSLAKETLKAIEEKVEDLDADALTVMADAASKGLGQVVEQPGLLKSIVQKFKSLL